MMARNRPMPQGAGFVPASRPAESPVLDPRAYTTEDYRNEIKRVKRKRRVIVVLCAILAVLVALLIAAVVVLRIPGSLQAVSSNDMAPVLASGDTALIQEIKAPAKGDVIMYRDPTGAAHFTRVVAVAEEWVNVASDNTVVVSDAPLESNSAAGVVGEGATIIASRQVPAGSCFTMTDADGAALEALYQEENYIDLTDVVGRAAYRAWPLTRIGAVS